MNILSTYKTLLHCQFLSFFFCFITLFVFDAAAEASGYGSENFAVFKAQPRILLFHTVANYFSRLV